MGQYFSSQTEEAIPRQEVVVPRQEVQVEIGSTYPLIKNNCKSVKKTNKKERLIDTSLIPVAKKPEKKGIMLRIYQNPIIIMNSVLVVAKGTVFENNGIARQFSHSLTSMIMETRTAQSMVRAYRSVAGSCRFLKVLVTTDDQYFLMPSVAPRPAEPNTDWAENLFADVLNLNGDKSVVLSYILSMIKQHKKLINKNEDFIFCLDIILNKSRSGVDIFHQDNDPFGDNQGGDKPIYISTTNISQESEFKLSTQIRISHNEELYTLASRLGEFTILNNKLLQHRTPPEINTRNSTITKARYEYPSEKTGNIPSYNMSSLSIIDPFVLENHPDIVKLNDDLSSPDPRNLLRILVKNVSGIDVTSLPDITHLVPSDTFISPSVTYRGTVLDNVRSEDTRETFSKLKDHSIGGKSKKKLRKKKKQTKKKKIVRKNYSYRQRGGAGDLSDLKYLNEYFAIYADPETACLIENNIEVII